MNSDITYIRAVENILGHIPKKVNVWGAIIMLANIGLLLLLTLNMPYPKITPVIFDSNTAYLVHSNNNDTLIGMHNQKRTELFLCVATNTPKHNYIKPGCTVNIRFNDLNNHSNEFVKGVIHKIDKDNKYQTIIIYLPNGLLTTFNNKLDDDKKLLNGVCNIMTDEDNFFSKTPSMFNFLKNSP